MPEESYYQLTHDYLVPSIREWLTRKQKETRRGRAELLLADRSSLWNAKPDNRLLPSVWEWANINLLTRKKDWTDPQRRMMQRASRVSGLRTLGLTITLALAIWIVFEVYGSMMALASVELVKTASFDDMTHIMEQMTGTRRLAKFLVVRRLETELVSQQSTEPRNEEDKDKLDQRQAMRAVALVGLGRPEKVWPMLRHSPDPILRSYIVNWLKPLGAGSKALMTRLESLAHNPGSIPKDGKSRMDAILFHPETSERRALILALGGYDPDELSPDKREPLVEHLLEMYHNDPDAGIHGAAEWTLRWWKQEEKLKKVDVGLQGSRTGATAAGT